MEFRNPDSSFSAGEKLAICTNRLKVQTGLDLIYVLLRFFLNRTRQHQLFDAKAEESWSYSKVWTGCNRRIHCGAWKPSSQTKKIKSWQRFKDFTTQVCLYRFRLLLRINELICYDLNIASTPFGTEDLPFRKIFPKVQLWNVYSERCRLLKNYKTLRKIIKGSSGKRWVLEKRSQKIPVKNLCQNITFCSEIIVKVKGIPIKSTEELIHILEVEMPIYRSEWHTW